MCKKSQVLFNSIRYEYFQAIIWNKKVRFPSFLKILRLFTSVADYCDSYR